MARKWETVSLEQAQAHPLYGRGGWLILFAVGNLVVLIALGILMSRLWAASTAEATSVKLVVSICALTPAIAMLLFALRSRWFRTATSALMLAYFPLSVLVALPLFETPGVAGAFTQAFLQWVVSCAVWVTYLQRSRRVRVTFEKSILSSDSVVGHGSERSASPDDRGGSQSPHAAPARQVVSPGMTASQHESTAEVTTDDEALWAKAYDELHGSSRRQGLWARVFAEASGDEPAAQAAYLRERVNQLSESANRGQTESVPTPPAGEETRAVIASPVDVSVARRKFLSGARLSRKEVEDLVGVIAQQPDLATLRENIRGGTMLHWSAVHGLVTEAKALLAAGADASAGNGNGRRPHELTENPELRKLLESASAARAGAAAGRGSVAR